LTISDQELLSAINFSKNYGGDMGFLSGVFKRNVASKRSGYAGDDKGCYISEDSKTGIFLEGSSEKVRGEVKTLLAQKLENIGETDTKGEIRRSLEEVNRVLYSEKKELSGIVFHQLEKNIVIVHIGISRAYIEREDEIIQITEDDTQGWQLFKSGLMEEKKLTESPLGKMGIKSLGRESQVQLNTGEYYFSSGEKLLLISGKEAMDLGDEKLWDIFGGNFEGTLENLDGRGYLVKVFN